MLLLSATSGRASASALFAKLAKAMPRAPSRVNWSDHAFAKAELLGLARADVEEAVLSGHARRARNPKSADWLVDFARYVAAYNYPDGDDVDAARIRHHLEDVMSGRYPDRA